jgi:hypothetical protein
MKSVQNKLVRDNPDIVKAAVAIGKNWGEL